MALDEHDIESIRSALGWKEGRDTAAYDAQIAAMTPLQRARMWAQWNLGDPAWADDFARLLESGGDADARP